MDKEIVELILLNYVDIIFVDSNPIKIDNTEICKVDGKLVTKTSSSKYKLETLNLKDINYQMVQEFNQVEPIVIDFYSKNFIGRFFKIKKYYNLYKEIEKLDSSNWIITNKFIFDRFLKDKDINVYINDIMIDKLIIGNRNDNIIIRVDEDIEYYIDKSNISVISLK